MFANEFWFARYNVLRVYQLQVLSHTLIFFSEEEKRFILKKNIAFGE